MGVEVLHGLGRACMGTMQVEKGAWGFCAGQKGCGGVQEVLHGKGRVCRCVAQVRKAEWRLHKWLVMHEHRSSGKVAQVMETYLSNYLCSLLAFPSPVLPASSPQAKT